MQCRPWLLGLHPDFVSRCTDLWRRQGARVLIWTSSHPEIHILGMILHGHMGTWAVELLGRIKAAWRAAGA